MKLHFIIARHNENMDWLWPLLVKFSSWTASIYNDGAPLEQIKTLEEDVQRRIEDIPGDKVPNEPSKYITYIIDNYDKLIESDEERYVFTQADPFYHSPYFKELLLDSHEWKTPYQTLTLYPHPPPWICAQKIIDGTAPNIQYFTNGGKVWSEKEMDNNFMGSFIKDPFCLALQAQGKMITVSDLCEMFSIIFPEKIEKTYCALFGTTAKAIRKLSKSQWNSIRSFVVEGDAKFTINQNAKGRGAFIEYMWAVFMSQP